MYFSCHKNEMKITIWICVSLSILSFYYLVMAQAQEGTCDATVEDCFVSDDEPKTLLSKDILFVSTIDGYVTAVNTENGELIWTVETGSDLFSSSLASVEFNLDATPVRMVPSLDGKIFKLSPDGLNPLPVDTDELLSSSFKLSDKFFVGNRENHLLAIGSQTGDIYYVCSKDGCRRFMDPIQAHEDILLIKRNSKSIRMIDPQTGAEKWSFNVGQNELFVARNVGWDMIVSDENFDHVEPFESTKLQEVNLRIFPTIGSCYALHKETDELLWTHKLSSPIVSAWVYKNGKLSKMELMDNLSLTTPSDAATLNPWLMLGRYRNQLYVQESPIFDKVFRNHMLRLQNGESSKLLDWILKPKHVPIPSALNAIEYHPTTVTPQIEGATKSTELVPYRVDGNVPSEGFYLYPDICDPDFENESQPIIKEEEIQQIVEDSLFDDAVNSIWMYWKEISSISLLVGITSGLFVYLLTRYRYRSRMMAVKEKQKSKPVSTSATTTTESSTLTDPPTPMSEIKLVPLPPSPIDGFVSRFYADFTQEECLGRGGFGVVFRVRNSIDDCEYAVKRITLPNRERAKKKVLREVQALAKLDHIGIVRYHNAWFETPPAGWQEDKDKKWRKDSESSTSSEWPVLPLSKSALSADENLSLSSNLAFEPHSKSALNGGGDTGFNGELSEPDFKAAASLSDMSNIIFEENSKSPANGWSSKGDAKTVAPIELNDKPKTYLYIQMQLCQRESLRDWLLSNKTRDRGEVLGIFHQITSAVSYVHSCSIIHRDLKTSNIFFAADGVVKIGDFGLSTELPENFVHFDPVKRKSDQKHTSRVGTELYMSPEQLASSSYNHKVDIFSLGLILFELLYPFQTMMERDKVLRDVRNCKFPKTFVSSSPKEIGYVTWLLNRNPELRPEADDVLNSGLFDNCANIIIPRSRHISARQSNSS